MGLLCNLSKGLQSICYATGGTIVSLHIMQVYSPRQGLHSIFESNAVIKFRR